jgi:V/A-type H+-transporting ATPase subunit I
MPSFLKMIAVPAFSNENPDAPTNIKIFCFTLGLIQISLAHVIGFIRNMRSPKALGELGTLMMTGGMYFVVLNLVVDSTKYPLSSLVIGVIFAGFALNFIFINYAGHIGRGVLESLKNFITMFLGVVNVFGDIMSYIRLWAVGLAGAAISATVNSMVGPMFGSFLMFLAVLVLVFGHGLNFVMNVLSVIVHGVRLNTLEFSNHLGLTWSGFKYEPFSETVRN